MCLHHIFLTWFVEDLCNVSVGAVFFVSERVKYNV